ncbi:MAG: hypothetical protein V4597_12730 [Pseudomonadota bacterium]
MRIALLAAVAVTLAGPVAAQPMKLFKPADANKDGVVTDDEQADYLAQKAKTDPASFGVAAPKPSGDAVTFTPTAPDLTAGPSLDTRAVKASEFEQSQDAIAQKAAAKK